MQPSATISCGLSWTLAYILRRIVLYIVGDPLERGLREEIVVANLVVLGGGVGACAGCFGSDHGKSQRNCYRHSYS